MKEAVMRLKVIQIYGINIYVTVISLFTFF